MPGQILINYEETYRKLAELRNIIESEVWEMNASYRQNNFAASRMDGKTNAIFAETMLAIQRKSQASTDTITKLVMFMDNSARQVEREEQTIQRIFDSSMITTSRPIRRGAE